MTKSKNEKLFLRLRQEYPVFVYESYSIEAIENELIIGFRFNIDRTIDFNPKIRIRTGRLIHNLPEKVDQIKPLLENIVFNIGMIELISYWKAACPPVIRIMPAQLTTGQAEWWKKLYFNGLGEFFYLNSIHANPSTFMEIESVGVRGFTVQSVDHADNYLIPIGGGKDSAVTLSLLKNNGEKIMPLIMNPRGATIETIKAAGLDLDDCILIFRTIDPKLPELNNQGFLNGHTPFSAMLAFYTLLCSALTGYNNIVLSNEGSANESTIPGTGINHQYSKSLEFENDFRSYYEHYISEDFNYFSLLRPLSELQIAGIFSKLPEYHKIFRSCNVGSKTDTWCGKCPKCLFTHIMLSAYMGIGDADRIIGAAMLDDAENEHTFDELTGYSGIKPFDCVGTTLEVKQALEMILDQKKNRPLPYLLSRFTSQVTEKIMQPDFSRIEEAHFVPDKLIKLLKLKIQ
ncbi:MAG: hypothetical protein IPH20_25580 [Bacteroidales bacterium]|nr:hypothetical protein [Bacteroidales bacterium]